MKGYHECPECGAEHKLNVKECGCGYRWGAKANPPDVHRGLCEWQADGMRCGNPGSCSTSTTGGGPWYCLDHSTCKDGLIGAEIVRRSHLHKPVHTNDAVAVEWLAARGIKQSAGMSKAEFVEVCREYVPYLNSIQPDRSRGTRLWAEKLRAREQRGEALSMMQRKAWREVLTVPNGASYDGVVVAREVSA